MDARSSSTSPSEYNVEPETVLSGILKVTERLVKYGFRLTFWTVITTIHVSDRPPLSVTWTVMLNVDVTVTSTSWANVTVPVVALMAKLVPLVIAYV